MKRYVGGILEIFLEIVMELYLEMAEMIVPDRKFKKWQKVLLQIACIVITLGVFFCLVIGISLLVEGGGTLGIALTSAGGALLVIQTVIFVIVVVHEVKSVKAAKDNVKAASEDDAREVMPKYDDFSEVILSEDDLSGVR